MRSLALLVTFSLAFPSFAHAGPVVPGNISADAKWFIHVNVEAINSMEVMQELRGKMEEDGRLKDRMQGVSQRIGMNPMEDLLAVTIYATQYEGDVGVGLFYVKNVDRKKLLSVLEESQPDHETSQHGDHTLYTWTVKHRRGEMQLTACFASKKLIVIGSDAGQVKAALNTIDGEDDGMDADSPLLAGASKKSLFVTNALDVPGDYQKTTKCPVLRKCNAASANLTEKKGRIGAKYVFTVESEETASGFKGIVDAGLAVGRSRAGDGEAVGRVLDGIETKVKGQVFTLTLKTTTDDIRDAVKQMMDGWRR
jgi:hypothetical protein